MPDPTLQNTNKGTSAIATTTATFGYTATAGRLLLLCIASDDYIASNPAGYTLSTGCDQHTFLGGTVWWKIAAGGETSVQYVINSASPSCWSTHEFDNVDPTPYDISTGSQDALTASFYATPALTPTTGRRLLISVVGGSSSDRNITATGAWTNSFAAANDHFTTVGAGTQDAHGVAYRVVDGDNSTSFTTTATFTVGGSVQAHTASIISFKVAAGGGGGNSIAWTRG